MNIFENKTTIDAQFSKMLSMAKEYFNSKEQKKHEFHQCLVLNSVLDEYKLLSFACDSVEELVNQNSSILSQEKNAPIRRVICMWEDGTIDVPSYQFLKKMCEFNIENNEAVVLLSAGTDIYLTKKIMDII